MAYWYKDRDFPELKRERFNEPNEILAIISDEDQLKAVIKAHNEEIEELYNFKKEAERYQSAHSSKDCLWRKAVVERADANRMVEELKQALVSIMLGDWSAVSAADRPSEFAEEILQKNGFLFNEDEE